MKIGTFLAPYSTKTATFQTTALDLGAAGTMQPSVLTWAGFLYKAASEGSGSHTVIFTVEHSADNSTFYLHTSGISDTITLTTTAQANIFGLPICTDLRYIRVVATISAGGGSPTIDWGAYHQLTRPG